MNQETSLTRSKPSTKKKWTHNLWRKKKNEKLCNKENLLTIYGGKSYNSTMTKENLTYYLWRKITQKKNWIVTYNLLKC